MKGGAGRQSGHTAGAAGGKKVGFDVKKPL
jgi:hypothetical protein